MSRSAAAPPDPYAVLEITRSATDAEIRAAYLALVSRYHPDRHDGNPLADLASAKLAEVNRAYEILSDPARRVVWDESHGAQGLPVGGATRGAQGKFFGRAIVVIVGLALALRFGPLVLRGLVGLLSCRSWSSSWSWCVCCDAPARAIGRARPGRNAHRADRVPNSSPQKFPVRSLVRVWIGGRAAA
jgi:hypothetical protein